MSLSVGIVGFPNAGKSTLFNALLKRQMASTAPYPFCTIAPNKGIVPVPDERLAVLAKIVKTDRIMPATVQFWDIAGLVKGAHKGQGLGNQFLGHIKETDLILYVLRDFDIEGVDRAGSSDPVEDLQNLKLELMLKDLDTLQKAKEPKGVSATKEDKAKWQTILKAMAQLEHEQYLAENLNKAELKLLRDKQLLTAKKYLVALNVLEDDLVKARQLKQPYQSLKPIIICAKTEEELAAMNEAETKEYLSTLGVDQSGLERLIQQAYQSLGLISFLTAGVKEVRAWTITKGTNAQQAAGVIHTDFSTHFIKAKIVDYDDFVKLGGWKNCQEQGKVRFEGRDYVMHEGEIVEFMIGK